MHHSCCRTTARGTRRAFAALLLSALAVSACNKASDKPASQIAAKVNDGEISVHQINFLLQRTPDLTPEKMPEARRQILDGLVDQELAVQEALAAELDRDPKVMQALAAARREVLARAYMEQTVTAKSRPSPEAVHAYYQEHPELFAGRKIYRLQEIGFAAGPEVVAEVRAQMAKARHAEELLNALRAKGIKVAGGIMVKPAERISMDILPSLAGMQDGQSALFQNDQRASIVTRLGAVPEPLTEEAARPFIERYLSRQNAGELARQTLQQLRDKARIEYVGDFSKDAEATRQARAAADARRAREAEAAREAARQVRAAEAARQAEALRQARAATEARAPAANRLPPPADSTIRKGISSLN